MDLNALEKNVTLLSTPYCDFSVLDEEGNAVVFDIMESPEKSPSVYIDNDSRKEKIVPSSMCEGKTLRISLICNAFINAGLPAFTGSYADWAQTLIYLCEMTFTIAKTVGSVKGAQTLTSKAAYISIASVVVGGGSGGGCL